MLDDIEVEVDDEVGAFDGGVRGGTVVREGRTVRGGGGGTDGSGSVLGGAAVVVGAVVVGAVVVGSVLVGSAWRACIG